MKLYKCYMLYDLVNAFEDQLKGLGEKIYKVDRNFVTLEYGAKVVEYTILAEDESFDSRFEIS